MFHHQVLLNNGPSTITSTVTGTKKVTQTITMTFTETVTNSACIKLSPLACCYTTCTGFTISEKVGIKVPMPDVASFDEETTVRTTSDYVHMNSYFKPTYSQVTEGFSFQFAASMSATTSVEQDLTMTFQISVPPFSNVTADIVMYSQVRNGWWHCLRAYTCAPQENVAVPFESKMYVTARDLRTNSTAVTQEQITGILLASGFQGSILGYNSADHSLLVKNSGVVNAAVATSVEFVVTCTPIPGHEATCPQALPVAVPGPEGSTAPATTLTAQATQPAQGSAKGVPGSVQYAVNLQGN